MIFRDIGRSHLLDIKARLSDNAVFASPSFEQDPEPQDERRWLGYGAINRPLFDDQGLLSLAHYE